MRFAILTHDHPFLHWDLLLEAGAACRTWRLLSPPDTPGPIAAEPLPDHRRMYLDHSGSVSGNRGSVTPWDAGELVWLTATPLEVAALVHGRHWNGRLQIHSAADVPDRAVVRLIPSANP